MTKFGKAWLLVGLLALALALPARAALEASVDRQRVALGDTLQLTVTVDGDEELRDLQLGALDADFEVLGQSTRSSMNIVNGKRSHIRSLLLDLVARREGRLTIPSLRLGNASSRPIAIQVDPPPKVVPGDEAVLFDAEVDRDSVHVQGQVLLTLRLQQSINLESRSITELRLDQAFVKQLGQNSYQRNAGGRTWLVYEVRYAIFPEQSGELLIPPQTFSARQSDGRRGLFSSGRQLRRQTEPLKVQVLPRPASYGNHAWLPAKNLRIEESWSVPPEQLRAGESATRTVRLYGEGLQGAQLPPILFTSSDGLKYYPDQPEIEDRESVTGLVGVRSDSAALVPTRAGTFTVPEIRIPWFDTESGEVREAVLPARTLQVAPGDAPGLAEPALPVLPELAEVPPPAAAAPVVLQGAHPAWPWLALASSAGWLITLGWLWWRRPRREQDPATAEQTGSERDAFKQLAAACAANSPARARQYLLRWGAAAIGGRPPGSLAALAQQMQSPELEQELMQLERALYSQGAGQWDGSNLASLVRRLRRERPWRSPATDPGLSLYPGT